MDAVLRLHVELCHGNKALDALYVKTTTCAVIVHSI